MSGKPFILKYVDFTTTRLVDASQNYHPSISVVEAKKIAQDSGLELVCFNKPQGTELAFCKIIDFNKWKYENEKRQKKEEKSHRKQCKEMRFFPNIADNDIQHKTRQINGFLDDGDDVILSMKLRGREKGHFSLAEEKMNSIVRLCLEHGKEISRKKSNDMIIVRLTKNNSITKTINEQENKNENNT